MDIEAQKSKQNKRYLPHTLAIRIGAVNLYRRTSNLGLVLRRYHISKGVFLEGDVSRG
ncbi:MAG: hypothetical protein LUH51_08050 [Firmicutes bacterium]|nr:hypothetical protein [Bacillota bacterium]